MYNTCSINGSLKNPPYIISTHTDVKEYIYPPYTASKKNPLKVYPRAIFCYSDQTQHILNSLDFLQGSPKQQTGLQGAEEVGKQTTFLILRSVKQ